MVGKLQRRSARAALGTVHHNKVGRNARNLHSFDDGKPLPRVANAQLKTGGLTTRELAQIPNKVQ